MPVRPDQKTIERLEGQIELLRRTYQSEFAKAPASYASASSRSNLIALLHTIDQVYGDFTKSAEVYVSQAVCVTAGSNE
jgi:hypothetical protein